MERLQPTDPHLYVIKQEENDHQQLPKRTAPIPIFSRKTARKECEHSPGRDVYLWFVRHGKPTEYARVGAGIDENGVDQMKHLVGDRFLQRARVHEGTGVALKILYSGFERTEQSARVFEEYVRGQIEERGMSHVQILTPRRQRDIEAHRILGPMIESRDEQGNAIFSKDKVYLEWMGREEEEIRFYGSRPPSEIQAVVERRLLRDKQLSERLGNGDPIYKVLFTHETFQGSIIKGYFPPNERHSIGFGEIMEFQIGPHLTDADAQCFYRGKTLPITINHEQTSFYE